jgi:hypothetical protein
MVAAIRESSLPVAKLSLPAPLEWSPRALVPFPHDRTYVLLREPGAHSTLMVIFEVAMGFFESYASGKSSAASLAEEDRRYNGRNRFVTRLQIRRMDRPQEEVAGTTQDLSRDGLYFIVRSPQYEVGMVLNLTLPASQSQWTCEVVRTESLPNGGQGVGVRILGFGS